jgi:hypothetical protein
MTGISFCRKPLPALARSEFMRWAPGGSDRGGQDKNRKVRTVGWVRNSARSGLFANIASVSRNLHFSTTRYRRSTIDTLRKDR